MDEAQRIAVLRRGQRLGRDRLAACGALEVVGEARRFAAETLKELSSGPTSTVTALCEEGCETLLAEARGAPRRPPPAPRASPPWESIQPPTSSLMWSMERL